MDEVELNWAEPDTEQETSLHAFLHDADLVRLEYNELDRELVLHFELHYPGVPESGSKSSLILSGLTYAHVRCNRAWAGDKGVKESFDRNLGDTSKLPALYASQTSETIGIRELAQILPESPLDTYDAELKSGPGVHVLWLVGFAYPELPYVEAAIAGVGLRCLVDDRQTTIEELIEQGFQGWQEWATPGGSP